MLYDFGGTIDGGWKLFVELVNGLGKAVPRPAGKQYGHDYLLVKDGSDIEARLAPHQTG